MRALYYMVFVVVIVFVVIIVVNDSLWKDSIMIRVEAPNGLDRRCTSCERSGKAMVPLVQVYFFNSVYRKSKRNDTLRLMPERAIYSHPLNMLLPEMRKFMVMTQKKHERFKTFY